ncbi:hypothetical protein FA15DRAFT_724085 [Coprinopsis marcescibilis]|uniref:Uncharacterized protein n=1 Tax=Coprinopsis marcescibilis TaxID=230819 RepID=A0A5C3LG73_COPMA|nr:hypothetical protein FA15DRAFT_724085 [Coprinopsis marcescibilis]
MIILAIPNTNYKGIEGSILEWIVNQSLDEDDNPTWAEHCIAHAKPNTIIFHLTSWAATCCMLSNKVSEDFEVTFKGFKMVPPQLLHTANDEEIWRLPFTNVNTALHNGAQAINDRNTAMQSQFNDLKHLVKDHIVASTLQFSTLNKSIQAVTTSV